MKKLKEERQSFLINIVKKGYYLNDGIGFFLKKMAQIGYRPTLDIFPEFLDTRSREFLIQQYEELLKKEDDDKIYTQRPEGSRIRAKSNAELGGLAKLQHFKDIYNGTKDYILGLLLQDQWKKQQTKLPKIGNKNNNQEKLQRMRQG